MSEQELLPCPFCGAPGVVGDSFTGMGRECWIACCNNNECPASEVVVDMPTRKEAIDAWNTRAPTPWQRVRSGTGSQGG